MGWYFTQGQSKKALVEELTADATSGESSREVLAYSVRGNQLWSVIKVSRPPSGGGHKRKEDIFIGLDLLQKSDGCWGHKPLSEDMEPYYYNCPLKFLDLAPVACERWRSGVREFHAEASRRRKMAVEVGMRFALKECRIPWVEIIGVTGRRIIGQYQGARYRVQKKDLGSVMN